MLKDMNGQPIPFGKTTKTLEENFLGTTALPSWLTFEGTGTHAIVPPNVDYGFLQLSTGEVANDTVTLKILPNGVNMNYVKELILELDSFCFDTSFTGLQYFINFVTADSQNGFTFYGQTSVLRGRKAGVVTEKTANYALEQNRRINLTFRIRNDGTVVLMEGDQIVFEYRFTTTEMDIKKLIYPSFLIRTLDGTKKTVRFSRVALSLVHN